MVYSTSVVKTEMMSLKDMIISILSEHYPLNINKIRKHLASKYTKSVSYQGVYKEIILLLDNNILNKEGKEYLLNEKWIEKLKEFSKNLYQKYNQNTFHSINEFEKLQKEGDMITLDFNSLKERDDFFIKALDFFNHELGPNEKIVMHYKHNRWPILNSEKLNTIMNFNENKNRCFNVSTSNTKLDKWAVAYQNDIGMNVKIIPNFKKEFNFQVFGDIVIQFHINEDIIKKLDGYFLECKNLNDFKICEFIEILNEKTTISAVIMKNSSLANSLKEEVLNCFKEELDVYNLENQSKEEYFY